MFSTSTYTLFFKNDWRFVNCTKEIGCALDSESLKDVLYYSFWVEAGVWGIKIVLPSNTQRCQWKWLFFVLCFHIFGDNYVGLLGGHVWSFSCFSCQLEMPRRIGTSLFYLPLMALGSVVFFINRLWQGSNLHFLRGSVPWKIDVLWFNTPF